MWFLELILVVGLAAIFVQDLKQRKVALYLFLLTGLLMSSLHFKPIDPMTFLWHIMVNLTIIALLVLVLFLYSRLILQKPLSKTFGLGDALFFIILALGFSPEEFAVLFSFSLIFAATLYYSTRSRLQNKTVPLAGFQALFLVLIYFSNWLGINIVIYN